MHNVQELSPTNVNERDDMVYRVVNKKLVFELGHLDPVHVQMIAI